MAQHSRNQAFGPRGCVNGSTALILTTAFLASGWAVAGAPRAADSGVAANPATAAYLFDGQPVMFKDGRHEAAAAPGSASRVITEVIGEPVHGDLDGDGVEDAALLFRRDSGGSGTFYYLAAALRVEGGYRGTVALWIGDRIAPGQMNIRNGIVTLRSKDRPAGAAMSEPPSIEVSRRFVLGAAGLVPVNAADTHVLADGSLRVEIEAATDRLAAEFGPRFDRTAVVRSVQLDGVELLGPWGLSDEFGLYGEGVLGYEAAGPGETFLKIGVGRLARDTAGDYQFAHPYPVNQLFPVEVNPGTAALSVSQRSDGDDPWQYLYRKSYALAGADGLTIHYELTNTGTSAWTFEHYNHHWFRLQDAAVGPGYEVITGFDLPQAETTFQRAFRSLRLQAPLAPEGVAYYASDLVGVPAAANIFSVQVDGVPIAYYQAGFAPHRFALYADEDGFCPEVFMRATLEPGATVSWSATYRFGEN